MPFQPEYSVSPERQAYAFQAGRTGCLMLHGFMGAPSSSRPLAQYLAQHGVTVQCPLLPGHGSLPNKLYRVSYQAWLDEAQEAFDSINEQCDEIFLMGHSMGTVLDAYLISRHREVNIRGLILLAPAYELPDNRLHTLRLLRYVMPWFYPMWMKRLHPLVKQRLLDFDPEIDLDDPDIQAKLPELTKVPTSGIDEMRKVLDMGRKLWPTINLPVVIFQGDSDVAVSLESTQKLFDILPGDDKQLQVIPGAGHELMRPFDPTHADVWSSIYQFVVDHTRKKDSLTKIGLPESIS
jgi:carboxylesterase